jgi:hypothetical protein
MKLAGKPDAGNPHVRLAILALTSTLDDHLGGQ